MKVAKLLKVIENKYVTYFLLFLIFLLGLYLRNINLPGHMLFGYEQGRDAQVVSDILSLKKFTLLGPQTDIQGIYHGAGYYYVLAIFYLIANHDPGKVIFLLTFFNALTIFMVYFISKEIIEDTVYSLFAALLAACSFDIIIYGRWLSNVSLSVLTVSIFFYFLIKLVKTKNNNYWIPLSIFTGLLSHFEILHVLYAVTAIIFSIFYFKLEIKTWKFLIGVILFFLINSTFLLFDLRHQFLLTNNFLQYFTSQALSSDPLTILYQYIDGLVQDMISSLYPSNGILTVFGMGVLLYLAYHFKTIKKKTFVLIFIMLLFSFPYIFLLKYQALEHFYAGTSIGWIMLLIYLLYALRKKINFLTTSVIIIIIVFANIHFINNSLPQQLNIFYQSFQPSMTYEDQLSLFDYIFTHEKQPFAYDAFTIPYYHEEAWQYLYHWYGKEKYPSQFAANEANPKKQILYLIIEPSTQGKYLEKWLKNYDATSCLEQTLIFDGIELQKREIVKKNPSVKTKTNNSCQ